MHSTPRWFYLLAALLLGATLSSGSALAKPDTFDGLNVPSGRIPQKIRDHRDLRTDYPNTERLAKDEMRVTALRAGIPNPSPSDVAASFLVELGNGESFLFDLAAGAANRLAGLAGVDPPPKQSLD
jgi:hypothetical protein